MTKPKTKQRFNIDHIHEFSDPGGYYSNPVLTALQAQSQTRTYAAYARPAVDRAVLPEVK
jgi:2-hydroxychromene-2-carboxylate isomerase